MRDRNIYLDTLRALAVMLVVLGHVPSPTSSAPALLKRAVEFFHVYGGLGVDLFFVLSGFLVSGLLFREQRATGSARVGRFLIRRGFKIYPAFYFFLVVTVVLRVMYGDRLTRADILSEAVFVQNYGAHVWSHTWSLAVEEHFYLLLAIIIATLQRFRPGPFRDIPLIFCAVTFVVLVARALTYYWLPYSVEAYRFPTHLQIDSLFCGVLLSHYYHTREDFVAGIRSRLLQTYAAAGVFVVLSQAIGHGAAGYLLGHVLAYTGFGLFVFAAACTPLPKAGRWQASLRRIAAVGAQSYSIYLWHTAVLVFGVIIAAKLLGHEPTFYQIAIGYTLAAFTWGVFMAKCVEQPSLALRERLFSSAPQKLAQRMPSTVRSVVEA